MKMMTREAALSPRTLLKMAVSLVLFAAPPASAAGQDEPVSDHMTVVYEGTRYALTRQLQADELRALLAGNTLIFIHPDGQEQEYHLESGQTLNGWAASQEASTGFWQIEGDEVCWTYISGTHCKPLYQSEREDLYGQVPGWYDAPLALIWEPGDSRGMKQRSIKENSI